MKIRKLLAILPVLALVLAACVPAETEPLTMEPEATEPVEAESPMAEIPISEETTAAETPTGVIPVSGSATVNVSETEDFGTILVDDKGSSLYMFEADTQNSGVSTCYDDCAEAWPPLLTDGPPVAGEGVDEFLLATLQRDDGSTQATYNGWPLYYYEGDTAPGDTAGQGIDGFGGLWWLIAPSGEPITE